MLAICQNRDVIRHKNKNNFYVGKTKPPHVIFPISTLLIGKKGKIFAFSQKARPKAIKIYQLAPMSNDFLISHFLSGKIIQKSPISLPLIGKTATISPISCNWRKKQIKTRFYLLAFTV